MSSDQLLSAGHTPGDPIEPARLAALEKAVELEVDRDDFSFQSDDERSLWDELEAEFHELVARIGPVWFAG